MKNGTMKKILALSLTAAIVFSGCGAKSNQETASPSVAPTGESQVLETQSSEVTETETETAYKAELNIAITANPPSLDTHVVNSNIVGGIGSHIYEPLFAMNAEYVPTPVLAESYTVSEDGKEYTIVLRKGIKFHNGQEMTADDVVASMTHWLENSAKAANLIGGSVFEKVDDYTVLLTVNEPSSDIMMVLAGSILPASIYPASSLENVTEDGITEYIGTGPYKLDEWKPDQYIRLVKNPDYQSSTEAPSGFTGAKNAPTETITFQIVTDDATRVAGLQTGLYDIIEELPLERYEELSADANLNLYTKAGGTLNLFFNTTKRALANETLRQAVLAALNCDDILMASYGDANLYTVAPGWCNTDDVQWASDAGTEYYNQNNIEKAKELMAEAGYNNEPIVLVTTPDYAEMYNSTLVVQEQLKQAGFNVEVESDDFSTFMEKRSNTDTFDLFITSNSYNLLPVQLTVLTEGWAGLNAPEVKEGITAIRSAKTAEEASKAWDDLQLFLYEYGAASVLGHYRGAMATTAKVEGFDYFHFPIYWNVKVAE